MRSPSLVNAAIEELTTELSGLLMAAGGVVVVATAGVNYVVPSALSAYALDSTVAHLAGTETFTGQKIFASSPRLPNGVSILFRDATNDGDILGIRSDGSNNILIANDAWIFDGGGGLSSANGHITITASGFILTTGGLWTTGNGLFGTFTAGAANARLEAHGANDGTPLHAGYPFGSSTAAYMFRADGSLQLPHLSDSAAVNDSLYYSTTQAKVTYKDSSGTPNPLY